VILIKSKTDKDKKWEIGQHSLVKHEILSKYLTTYIHILGSKWNTINIIDGFAGKGEYITGERGSPIHILDCCKEISSTNTKIKKFNCFFIEEDPVNYANLDLCLKRYSESEETNIEIDIIHWNCSFEQAMDQIFAEYKYELENQPSFFFIDPFGHSGVSFSTIRRIFRLGKSYLARPEIFLNLMVNSVNRWKDTDQNQKLLTGLFGTDTWHSEIGEICSSVPDMDFREGISLYYRKRLSDETLAKFTCRYRFRSSKTNVWLYDMIHATTHFKGLQVMKDIMYNTGVEGAFEFYGRNQKIQLSFSRNNLYTFAKISLEVEKAKRWISALVENLPGLSFDEILEIAYPFTPFVVKNIRSAVKQLEKDQLVIVERISSKRDGVKGLDKIWKKSN